NLHYEQIGKEVRCIEDELPFEIPVNWVWCRMNSIGTMIRGNGIKRCEIVDEGLPCIRYGEIYTSYNLEFRKVFSKIPQQLYDSCKKIKHGDLIFTLTGENKPDIAKTIAYLGDTEIAAGGDLAIWSNHHMNPLYLSYLLYSPYMISKKISLATGDIIVHISVDKVGSFLAPIPPLEEQNKIVNRLKMLESLISKYSEKENELYALNSNIKEQLKKSILQYAIEGKLVQQDSNDEPASVLLERIREEKNKLIAEGKIKKDKNESIIYRRDNSYYEKLGNREKCINEEVNTDLPNSWVYLRLGEVCKIINGFTPLRTKQEYWSNPTIPWFTVDDIHLQGRKIYKTKQSINACALGSNSNRILPRDTVLLCCTASVGEYAIAKIELTTNQQFNGLVIKPEYKSFINSSYLFILTSSFENALIKMAGKTTFNFISVKKLSSMLIPVPPLKDQMYIANLIEKINSILE
ncbi:restriction endonuclease subunit S, partial [Holdemanella biformis]